MKKPRSSPQQVLLRAYWHRFALNFTASALTSLATLAWAAPSAPPVPAEHSQQRQVSAEVLTSLKSSLVAIEAIVVPEGRTVPFLGDSRNGSGIVVDPVTVLTIGYLLLEADEVTLTTASGRKFPASVAAYDHASGLGLVRAALPLDSRPIAFGDSSQVFISERLLAFSAFERDPTEVIVVSRRPFSGSWEYLLERPIYTFPPIADWSGSALTNKRGELLGVGSLRVDDAAEMSGEIAGNMFVPIELLVPVLDDLRAQGRRATPAQPWLGVSTRMLDKTLVAIRLALDGPAEKAGMQTGDEIIAVAGQPVRDQPDFYRKVWKIGSAGTDIPLTIQRDEKRRDIRIRSIDRMSYLRRPEGI